MDREIHSFEDLGAFHGDAEIADDEFGHKKPPCEAKILYGMSKEAIK